MTLPMTSWQDYLSTQKANIQNNRVLDFGNTAAELATAANGTILADLSHLGLLQLEGDDRVAFLQGQVTNDVHQLDGSRGHYSGYCTPKGRLLALFLAFGHHDHLHLQLNRELLEQTLKRLKMYVLRSKVSIRDVSDEIIRIGLAGAQAESLLQGLTGDIPTAPLAMASTPLATIIRMPGAISRFEIFTSPEHAPQIWQSLSTAAMPVGADSWEWLEINAGIPEIYPATLEAFVPQMVNLDVLNGINFKKGCYTGQEIVARTHYLGKVKRRTLALHISSSQPIHPGQEVYASGIEEPAGMLVRAAPSPEGGWDALAEVRLEAIEGATLALDNMQQHKAELRALAYELDTLATRQ